MFPAAMVFWLDWLVAQYSAARCPGASTAIPGMVSVSAPWPVLGVGFVPAPHLGAPTKVSKASSDWGVPSPALNPCVICWSCVAKSPCGVVRGVVSVTDVVVGLSAPLTSPDVKRTTDYRSGTAAGAAAIPSATPVYRRVPPAVSLFPSTTLLSVNFFPNTILTLPFCFSELILLFLI